MTISEQRGKCPVQKYQKDTQHEGESGRAPLHRRENVVRKKGHLPRCSLFGGKFSEGAKMKSLNFFPCFCKPWVSGDTD